MEQTLALIKRSHKGDKDARNILAQQNMGLVYTVARRFNGRGCEMEDLIQIGSIGLLKAIDKFDLSDLNSLLHDIEITIMYDVDSL